MYFHGKNTMNKEALRQDCLLGTSHILIVSERTSGDLHLGFLAGRLLPWDVSRCSFHGAIVENFILLLSKMKQPPASP